MRLNYMKTKTIEERAKDYASKKADISLSPIYNEALARIYEEGYMTGAKEQKAIDDAELLKLKSAWEKVTYINPYDEANYKQGYHDAIEKACEWLDNYLMEIGYPDDWMRDSPNMESGKERFRKAMEE